MDTEFQSRVARLEQQNRALAKQIRFVLPVAVAALIVGPLGWLMGAQPANGPGAVVSAQVFELVDADGVVRGQWTTRPSQEQRALLDRRRLEPAGKRVDESLVGSTLEFRDSKGVSRSAWSLWEQQIGSETSVNTSVAFASSDSLIELGVTEFTKARSSNPELLFFRQKPGGTGLIRTNQVTDREFSMRTLDDVPLFSVRAP